MQNVSHFLPQESHFSQKKETTEERCNIVVSLFRKIPLQIYLQLWWASHLDWWYHWNGKLMTADFTWLV